MSGYTKLFNSILASTVWSEPDEVRIAWITLLAMAGKDGIVEGSTPGLSVFARLSLDATRKALERLASPDPDSRSKEHEGRRIEAIEGGWRLINHAKYRQKLGKDERREYLKIKQREQRAKNKAKKTLLVTASTNVNTVSDKYTESTHTEAEADTAPEPDRSITNQVPRNNPPTPLKGGRISRSDRQKAEHIRTKSWGLCKHEPRCNVFKDCVDRIARDITAGIAV